MTTATPGDSQEMILWRDAFWADDKNVDSDSADVTSSSRSFQIRDWADNWKRSSADRRHRQTVRDNRADRSCGQANRRRKWQNQGGTLKRIFFTETGFVKQCCLDCLSRVCFKGSITYCLTTWTVGIYSSLCLYTVSQKNDTDVTHYRFNPHQPISVIFGRDVVERVYIS